MQENTIPTKESLNEDLNKAKESVSVLKLKIENPADLEKLAEDDIDDLKDELEAFKEKIASFESKISELPESTNEEREIEDLKFIKQQLFGIAYKAEENMKKFLTTQTSENKEEQKNIEPTDNKNKGQESTESFPEGHIMDPKILDKIAQLEAISPSTLEFDQQRYDDYINSSEGNTIQKSQDEIKRRLNEGKKPNYDNVSIYGKGGWNRYDATDGIVRLSRGSTVSTGTEEYKAKLAQKAKELGIRVELQQ